MDGHWSTQNLNCNTVLLDILLLNWQKIVQISVEDLNRLCTIWLLGALNPHMRLIFLWLCSKSMTSAHKFTEKIIICLITLPKMYFLKYYIFVGIRQILTGHSNVYCLCVMLLFFLGSSTFYTNNFCYNYKICLIKTQKMEGKKPRVNWKKNSIWYCG